MLAAANLRPELSSLSNVAVIWCSQKEPTNPWGQRQLNWLHSSTHAPPCLHPWLLQTSGLWHPVETRYDWAKTPCRPVSTLLYRKSWKKKKNECKQCELINSAHCEDKMQVKEHLYLTISKDHRGHKYLDTSHKRAISCKLLFYLRDQLSQASKVRQARKLWATITGCTDGDWGAHSTTNVLVRK